MTVWRAFADGLARVARAPSLVAGLWLATVLLAWPLALTLRSMLAAHLGDSLAADAAAIGVNHDWWQEFLAQTSPLGQTFVPAVIGVAAVLQNISSIADAQGIPATAIAGVVSAHLVLSLFLTGGVLDRLARDHRVGTFAFFAACGVHFLRLLRLSLIAGVVYSALFLSLHPWLFDTMFSALTRDVTVERTAIAYRFALYLGFGALVASVNLLFDYARVRMVVEDRRSAIGALNGSVRFLARHAPAAVGLYVLNVATFAALVAGYALVAPGASGGVAMWIGFAVGQLYIALRVAVRLLFSASEIALFQSRLAHAGYTAAPMPSWPDSPAAEAIIPR